MIMKSKYYIITIVNVITMTIICFYFYEQNKLIEVITSNDTRPIELLKKIVIDSNDKSAYNELTDAYLNEQYHEEVLFYSLLMANISHYRQAYFDFYHLLKYADRSQGIKIFDNETRLLMIEYLKKGVALKHEQSMHELGELYMEGKYVPKDTILGKKLINSIGL